MFLKTFKKGVQITFGGGGQNIAFYKKIGNFKSKKNKRGDPNKHHCKKFLNIDNKSPAFIWNFSALTYLYLIFQATLVINRLSVLGDYMDILRRSVTMISIIVVIIDAIKYLQSYLTDSSFDNDCIDRHTRKYWKSKDYYRNTSTITYI